MDETIINGIIEASQEVIGQLQYAIGVKGDTGDSGVYIGTTTGVLDESKVSA